MAVRVGVISDTHGLLRPEALQALAESHLIIHAGDIGSQTVLEELRRLAPVEAIRGNLDTAAWASNLHDTLTLEIEQVRIFVLHDRKELPLHPADADRRCVISGHSHKASSDILGGVLFLNPGSAGPRRFRLPVSVATLFIDGRHLSAEILSLAV